MSARLWSQKGKTGKYIDMNTEIDDLLEVVSPELVRNYETLNLGIGKQTLEAVNEEYKRIDKNPNRLLLKAMKLFLGTMMIGAVSLVVLTVCFDEPIYIGFIPLLVLVGPVLFWLHGPLKKRLLKNQEALARCTPILESFRTSVAALGSPLHATMREYTEVSVHRNFHTHAVRILDAENKLDAVRKQDKRETSEILRYANWLEKCQKEFRKASEGLKKFGLKFDNDELFAYAKKHLES